jgi:endonuclease/exonuclease/phosphatase family metal-dependent hydrolase
LAPGLPAFTGSVRLLIRLLSINIWDLPLPLPGFARRSRRRRLLRGLSQADADLILIQESFLPSFRPRLAAALKDHQPDHCYSGRRRHFVLPMDTSGGLATFSRLPLLQSFYQPFRLWSGMKPDERIGRKGCLWTEYAVNGGRVLVGNAHLYAGMGARPGRVRAIQVRELLRRLERFPPMPTILAGDFNMAIEHERTTSGPTGFDLMTAAGFAEVAAGATGSIATLSRTRNPFARYTPWPKPDRRLTHVFFKGRGLSVAESPSLCFDDPPVSDHFGLLATLAIQ